MSWTAGDKLAHYHLIEQIGRGGMGVVWRALDTRLGREVAIKALPPEMSRDPERLRLFQAEAKSVAAVSHPGVVTIYSVEEHGDTPFITLELVDGVPLSELIPERGLELDRAIVLGRDLAAAVEAAHRRNIVHGDLKPANVMVDAEDRIKVLDFGLARARGAPANAVADADTTADTARQKIAGSLPYMAPEQLLGGTIDPRADIFAIGVMLYEMLAGERPFRGATPGEIVPALIRDDPEPLSRLREDVPEPLEAVVRKCLQKERGDRYASVAELRHDLASIARARERYSLVDELAIPLPSFRETPSTSIAVVPLRDLSPEGDQAHLCAGIAEEILDALAGVRGVRTASGSAAAKLAGEGRDAAEIGRELGADFVLEGSVSKMDDRLRIKVRLNEVSQQATVWTRRFDRHSRDIFAIQDEITAAVVDRLHVIDSGPGLLTGRTTNDAVAYELYLKGRFFWNQRYAGGLERALEHFGRAIECDPSYALAYVGLADCYVILGHYSYVDPAHAYPEARSAVERAMELVPDLAEAHASMAWIRAFRDYRRDEAEGHFRKMFEGSPSYATGHEWYGLYLISGGRHEDAIAVLRRAAQLDPIALIIPSIRAYALHCAGLGRDCERVALQALEMNPDFMFANLMLGMNRAINRGLGDPLPSLRKAAELSGNSPLIIGHVGYALGIRGHRAEAREVLAALDEAAESRYVPDFARAVVYHGLGEVERALDAFEAAAAVRDSFFVTAQSGPYLRDLRSEPRFRAILDRMGLGETSAGA